MLTHLSIRNFAIVNQLDMELSKGMTAITGETGAGKSIMLDALSMALGGRADSSVVPDDSPQATISATFDINSNSNILQWLTEHDLTNGEDECLFRRVITREGRSRAYINDRPVSLQQLRQLGDQLVDIHSQHEHQSLLSKDTHRQLLDNHAAAKEQAETVSMAFNQWHKAQQKLTQLSNRAEEDEARLQLLRYQVEELDNLDLQVGEVLQLEKEYKLLANAEQLLGDSDTLINLCNGENSNNEEATGNLQDLFAQASQILTPISPDCEHLKEALQLFESARIQVEEACFEINQHRQAISINPDRLRTVEQRLDNAYQIARKHRINADEIPHLHQGLSEQLQALDCSDADMEALEQEVMQLLDNYQRQATELTNLRRKAASKLAAAVNKELGKLNMKGSAIQIELTPRYEPHALGQESIEFLVRTNPGQPFQALKKVASGGELSRISLAIQVITVKTSGIPTLIFDEVDVGIGGDTADRVGQLLRKLGEKGQVLCVTHQATVAAKAHQHLYVTKSINNRRVSTALVELDNKNRIEEVARMIGGEAHTEQSRAHAELLLQA